MTKRRTLQELTIKDPFLFAAVMQDPAQCRRFLSLALEMKVLEVTIVTEKTLSYHPDYHGIRLDVLAEEEGRERRFDVEMQVESEKDLPRRSRYYHSQMDMDALLAGRPYGDLPETYVIFICDYDPVGRHLYRYTSRTVCEETGEPVEDGSVTVWLSTEGRNPDDVPRELVSFLNYVDSPDNYEPDPSEAYVVSLQTQVAAIKKSREWEAKFMLLRELMDDERAQGRAQGRAEGLAEGRGRTLLEILGTKGNVPEAVSERILREKDTEVLKRWTLLLGRTSDMEEFIRNM